MAVLHMETEQVRSTAQQLDALADNLKTQVQILVGAINNLAWQSPGRENFVIETDQLFSSINHLGDVGNLLSQRVRREVDEWIDVDHQFGVGTNASQILVAENPVPESWPTPEQPIPGVVNELKDEIKAASNGAATPELIAAILADEANRRDYMDDLGDKEAWFILKYEGKLEDIERYLLAHTFGPIEEISLGKAQMNPEVVIDMVEQGYIPKPDGWENDKLDISLQWLLDDNKAPELVAARINQTVDHWKEGGVDISNRPEIIGTLYSIGLEGKDGVRINPEFSDRGSEIAGMAVKIGESF